MNQLLCCTKCLAFYVGLRLGFVRGSFVGFSSVLAVLPKTGCCSAQEDRQITYREVGLDQPRHRARCMPKSHRSKSRIVGIRRSGLVDSTPSFNSVHRSRAAGLVQAFRTLFLRRWMVLTHRLHAFCTESLGPVQRSRSSATDEAETTSTRGNRHDRWPPRLGLAKFRKGQGAWDPLCRTVRTPRLLRRIFC
jgi:hypothetical protein